jgi:hypothetical protein
MKKLLMELPIIFSVFVLLSSPAFAFDLQFNPAPEQHEHYGHHHDINERIHWQWRRIERDRGSGALSDSQAEDLKDNLRRVRHWYERSRDEGTLDQGKIEWYNRMLDKNQRFLERAESGQGGFMIRLW